MERCTICDTPLEEGFLSSAVGSLAWTTDVAGGDGTERLVQRALAAEGRQVITRVSASRCPRCQVGVFSYDS